MQKQLDTTEHQTENSLVVREPTEELLQERNEASEKGSAVVKDVKMEPSENDWYDFAVFKFRYSDDTVNVRRFPVYKTEYVDDNLGMLLDYIEAENLYDSIGSEVPALKTENGRWYLYIPSDNILFGSILDRMHKLPITRVKGKRIRPNIGLPILVCGLAALLSFAAGSPALVAVVTTVAFIISMPMVSANLPGEVV